MRMMIALTTLCTVILFAVFSTPALAAGHGPYGDCDNSNPFPHSDHDLYPASCLTEYHGGDPGLGGLSDRMVCEQNASSSPMMTIGDVNVIVVDDGGGDVTLQISVKCAGFANYASSYTPLVEGAKCYKDFVLNPARVAATCETPNGTKYTDACD